MKTQLNNLLLLMLLLFSAQLTFAQLLKSFEIPGTNTVIKEVDYFTPKTNDVLFPRGSSAYEGHSVYQDIFLQRSSTPEEICFDILMRKALYGQQIKEFILENNRVLSAGTLDSIEGVIICRHLLANSNDHAHSYMNLSIKNNDFVSNFIDQNYRAENDKFIIDQHFLHSYVPFQKNYNDQSEYQKFRSLIREDKSTQNEHFLRFPPDYLYDNDVFDPTFLIFLFELWYDHKINQRNY